MSFRNRLRSVYAEFARFQASRKNIKKALKWVGKMEAIKPLEPFERAFKATLLLINGDPSLAEKIYLDIVSNSGKNSGDDAYIVAYAQFMLNEIRGELENAQIFRKRALACDCRPVVRRFLSV